MKFLLRCRVTNQYLGFAVSMRLGILKCLNPVLWHLSSLCGVKQRLYFSKKFSRSDWSAARSKRAPNRSLVSDLSLDLKSY